MKNFPLIAGKNPEEIAAFSPQETNNAARQMYEGFLKIATLRREQRTETGFDEKEQAALRSMLDLFYELVSRAGGYETVFSEIEVKDIMDGMMVAFFDELGVFEFLVGINSTTE